MRQWLTSLATMPESDEYPDLYGVGSPVRELENRVAKLLDKPAARFVVKGVIAQQAALRSWTDATGIATVGLHPRSHLDLDELGAFERLHHLRAVRLGEHGTFSVAELEAVGEPLGAVTVELPLRNAGFALPEWDELVAVSQWCRERGVAMHLDGARLWESAPYYDVPVSDIAALADSVYVSFYKGVGGLGGCALAGSEDFLARAAPWLTRHGADVFTTFPYTLSALAGMDRYLPQIPAYRARALTLAHTLGQLPGVTVNQPQTNSFPVFLAANGEALDAAHLRLAERTGTWLFNSFATTRVPGITMAEVQVGEATRAISDSDAAAMVQELLNDVATPA